MMLSWKGLQVPNTNFLGQFVSYEENEELRIRTQTFYGKNDLSQWQGFMRLVAAGCSADARLIKHFHSLPFT